MNPFAEQEAWEDHQIGNYLALLFIFSTHPNSCVYVKLMNYSNQYLIPTALSFAGKATMKFGSKDKKHDDYE